MEHKEKQVYGLIEKSGTRGIGNAEIKKKLSLANTIARSALKKLEKLGLIKSYKPKNKNQKMYLLEEYEPDSEIVGGAFYSDGKVN